MKPAVFIHSLISRSREHKIFDMAAQLAYYLLLALFPFLILLFHVLRLLPISPGNVLEIIQPYAPASLMNLIETNLYAVLENTRGDLLSISMIVTLWLAFMGMSALIRTLNTSFQVLENRSLKKSIAIALFITMGLMLGVTISLALSVFGQTIGVFMISSFNVSVTFLNDWNIFRWGISFLVLMGIFSFLYLAAPNITLRVRDVLPGTLFSTIGWQLASLGFSYYISFTDYSIIYGNLGTLVILMIWFYISALVVLIGGEINAVLLKR
ncbi:YihY/virulence factor BrkB family protein [Halobacillus massiliensis]|uniref:YihY/virulence factor BrkB family protein n=1 Tax=Halobacillus massiliensis TaxID=1926286 RepID=UPI0009E538A6|nr:YihY/virulence factor BrkB family protein [Halobacillus massiliensis]